MSWSPRSRAWLVLLLLSTTACARLGLVHGWMPPVLGADLDLASRVPQSTSFEYGPWGTYELRYHMNLRNGGGSSPTPQELAGTVSIHDADGTLELRQTFREQVGPNQTGGTLLRLRSPFSSREPHVLTVELEASPQLLERYSDLHVALAFDRLGRGSTFMALFLWLIALLGFALSGLLLRPRPLDVLHHPWKPTATKDSRSDGAVERERLAAASVGNPVTEASWRLLGRAGIASLLYPLLLGGGWLALVRSADSNVEQVAFLALGVLVQVSPVYLIRWTASGRFRSGPRLIFCFLAALVMWVMIANCGGIAVLALDLTY